MVFADVEASILIWRIGEATMFVASNGSGGCGFFDEFYVVITLFATWLW
jgi:hypothetical protein